MFGAFTSIAGVRVNSPRIQQFSPCEYARQLEISSNALPKIVSVYKRALPCPVQHIIVDDQAVDFHDPSNEYLMVFVDSHHPEVYNLDGGFCETSSIKTVL